MSALHSSIVILNMLLSPSIPPAFSGLKYVVFPLTFIAGTLIVIFGAVVVAEDNDGAEVDGITPYELVLY